MEGFYASRADSSAGRIRGMDDLQLLVKQGNLEIMTQTVIENATVWLVPAKNKEDLEFFFIHTGEVEITLNDEIMSFGPGESFYTRGLKEEIFVKFKKDTLMLYISTCPVFDTEVGFQTELIKMVEQINSKDNYTYRHSRHVMKYAVKLYEKLREYCTDDSARGLVVAALFHDVGKCRTPDSILKKKGRLNQEEYGQMMHHPIDSANLLEAYFDKRVVELAKCHHERLDGSGYPCGLSGDEIPFEGRILAVADVFDAMTTDRGYNCVKSFQEAALEIQKMPNEFDSRVSGALVALVNENAIQVDTEG